MQGFLYLRVVLGLETGTSSDRMLGVNPTGACPFKASNYDQKITGAQNYFVFAHAKASMPSFWSAVANSVEQAALGTSRRRPACLRRRGSPIPWRPSSAMRQKSAMMRAAGQGSSIILSSGTIGSTRLARSASAFVHHAAGQGVHGLGLAHGAGRRCDAAGAGDHAQLDFRLAKLWRCRRR